MLVIFEGVDGTGKSTLIKNIKELTGWKEVIWPGKGKAVLSPKTREDHVQNAKAFIQTADGFLNHHQYEFESTQIFLMDRAGLGEIIYGSLENRLTLPIKEYSYWFNYIIKNCIWVHCHNSEAHEFAMKRGEVGTAADKDNHDMIRWGYKAFFDQIDHIKYDFTQGDEAKEIIGDILGGMMGRFI
jgi:thymidylate kinase